MALLSDEQLNEKLKQLEGWKIHEKWLVKEFEFMLFAEAIMFVNDVAGLAEERGHHPDICVHSNTVILKLSTHSENGITDKDTRLASDIEKIRK